MFDTQNRMPRRHLPLLNEANREFWQSGQEGSLQIARCQTCSTFIHPPSAACRNCHSRDIRAEKVSGKGSISTFTINRHPWEKDLTTPFVIAIVTLAEQPGLNLMTNIVNCPIDNVTIGMKVRVIFENIEDVWLPLFEPDPIN